jgi:hypothetical protein
MGKHQPEINKKKLIEALERSLGIVTPACKEVGISRNTFYEYYKTDTQFKDAVDDINEIALDFTEQQLFKSIRDGNYQAIAFYMKYKGRKRGYSERIELEGSIDINKITFEIINRNKDDDGTED